MKLYINYHGTKPIEKIAVGDWIDLRAAEDVVMMVGEYKVISLGISVKLPEGYEAHLAARSHTYDKWGIFMPSGIGIIDNSYSGNNDIWGMPVVAARDTFIEEGSRIAQFRIMERQPDFEIIPVDHLDGPDRGGFGSTGHL